MVSLSPADVSILTRVAQYRKVPIDQRLELLAKASAQAQEIGKVVLQQNDTNNNGITSEISEAAQAVTKWTENNRRFGARKVRRRSKLHE